MTQIDNTGRVAGKVAIVTGAASGIGLACAERLAAEGASVLLTDVDQAAGQAAAARLAGAGAKVAFSVQDVTCEETWQQIVAQAEAQFGALTVLVNNAGIALAGRLVDLSLEDWRRQQAVNLEGVFLGIKHSIPAMVRSGEGSIINLSSVAGLRGANRLAAYCATKGGVRLLSKAMAVECGAEGWPIRVNSVHPGVIDTPIWQTIEPPDLAEGANEVDLDGMTQTTALGRPGQAMDIANGVLFLASDDSSYMTGTELVIDAGFTA